MSNKSGCQGGSKSREGHNFVDPKISTIRTLYGAALDSCIVKYNRRLLLEPFKIALGQDKGKHLKHYTTAGNVNIECCQINRYGSKAAFYNLCEVTKDVQSDLLSLWRCNSK